MRELGKTLLVAALALAAGCSRAAPPPARPLDPGLRERLDREFEALVARYSEETGARQISVAEALEKLRTGAEVVFLDIRSPEEQAVSVLPGARLLSPDRVSSAPLELPPEAAVVTYCTAGYRSGLAATALEKRLGRPVFSLTGGIIAWFNAGGEVRDPEGRPVDRVHPFGEKWAKYVRPREERSR